eukprot:176295_1
MPGSERSDMSKDTTEPSPTQGQGDERPANTLDPSTSSTVREDMLKPRRTRGSTEDEASTIARLSALKNLFDSGFMSKDEFEIRKNQLIDSLTGTSVSSLSTGALTRTLSVSTHPTRSFRHPFSSNIRKASETFDSRVLDRKIARHPPEPPTIVPRQPPNFDDIDCERAIEYSFDISTLKWRKQNVEIKLDPIPFARGGLRLVYHVKVLNGTAQENSSVSYVAKLSMDTRDDANRTIYFRDVEMQSYSKQYAAMFNKYKPPKKVDFVLAFNLELIDRENNPICGVERFIAGEYRKHNNNHGYVSEEERNTPQAFSHFTYEASNHSILICDIQGVGDLYTDPQMHSTDGKGFGKGNLGKRGFEEFLKSHRCNAICRYLKLPIINANKGDVGTLPSRTYMIQPRVTAINMNHQGGTIPCTNLQYMERGPLSQLKEKRSSDETQTYIEVVKRTSPRFFCCSIL